MNKTKAKKCIDILMAIVLMFLMAYQVTGEALHEWTGVTMTVLVVLHHILNIRWYGALLKGKYNAYRAVLTIVNLLLMASFILTAFCGMSMSGYAVPFLYGMAPVSLVRVVHLALSHWSFVLMGIHIGLHLRGVMNRQDTSRGLRMVISVCFMICASWGFYLFLKNGFMTYMTFRAHFAFLDYDKAGWLVLVENVAMLSTWVFIGLQIAQMLAPSRGNESGNLSP